ncbi:MAG: PHP domain-containing protein [Deltaproteobacteria bacterium]|nr:PHP domain-containing protein [Deltaproteobacteria bacterium]
MTPDELMKAARQEGLDGVCITEHNRIWSPAQAKALSDKHGLAVFRGVEITTSGGDILVYGMDEEPDGLLSPAVLRKRVDAAGAIAIAAHPFRGFLVFGFGALQMDLESAMDNPTFSQVHGLEICNGLVTPDENDMARQVAEAMGLLMIGGSDAHRTASVGTCVTVFEDRIHNEKDLVAAIRSSRFTVERRE